MINLETILKQGQILIEKAIILELKDQGHVLTGTLERSLSGKIKNNYLDGLGLNYALKLDSGIKASDIRIDSQALAEMTKYVELRMGYRGKKASIVAYRILKKQSKEGNPTNASSRFSKSGKRTDVLKIAFKKVDKELDETILKGLDEYAEKFFK